MPKPTTQHRSQAITGVTHIKVLSPALQRWQVALILGVTERTVINWEKSLLTAERIGRVVRYPAGINGLSQYIELVNSKTDATPRP